MLKPLSQWIFFFSIHLFYVTLYLDSFRWTTSEKVHWYWPNLLPFRCIDDRPGPLGKHSCLLGNLRFLFYSYSMVNREYPLPYSSCHIATTYTTQSPSEKYSPSRQFIAPVRTRAHNFGFPMLVAQVMMQASGARRNLGELLFNDVCFENYYSLWLVLPLACYLT